MVEEDEEEGFDDFVEAEGNDEESKTDATAAGGPPEINVSGVGHIARTDSVATPQTNAAPLVLFTSETPSDKKGAREEDDPFAAAFITLDENKKEDVSPVPPKFDLFSSKREKQGNENVQAPGAASWFSLDLAGGAPGGSGAGAGLVLNESEDEEENSEQRASREDKKSGEEGAAEGVLAAELTLEEDGSEQHSSVLSSSAKEEEQKHVPVGGGLLKGEVSMKSVHEQKPELSENALLNDFMKEFMPKGLEVVGRPSASEGPEGPEPSRNSAVQATKRTSGGVWDIGKKIVSEAEEEGEGEEIKERLVAEVERGFAFSEGAGQLLLESLDELDEPALRSEGRMRLAAHRLFEIENYESVSEVDQHIELLGKIRTCEEKKRAAIAEEEFELASKLRDEVKGL